MSQSRTVLLASGASINTGNEWADSRIDLPVMGDVDSDGPFLPSSALKGHYEPQDLIARLISN